mgnify:CR=1
KKKECVSKTYGDISLRSSGNHVLDEITMSGSINHSEEMTLGLEFPQGNIDGDTSLTLGFELVQNPSVLERTLTGLGGLLLVLSDNSLVDTSTLVDQVSGGRGFTGVDVSDNDKGNVRFLVAWHCYLCKDLNEKYFFSFLSEFCGGQIDF